MSPSGDDDGPAKRTDAPVADGLRIAVVFFGITRSLSYTLDSITRNVIAPARATTPNLRTFGHFYDQDRIDNPRSNEAGVLDPDEFRLLALDEVEREAPGGCLELHDFERLKAAGDKWDDNFVSLGNLVHQLHSLGRATAMALAWKPDLVIFARPDLYYHNSMAEQIATVAAVHGPLVHMPDWAQWKGHNDRFAIAKGGAAIAAYGGRVTRLSDYVARGKPMHSERFLKFVLQDIPTGTFGLRGSRVRSNGMVVLEDFTPGHGKRGRLRSVPIVEFEGRYLSNSPAKADVEPA